MALDLDDDAFDELVVDALDLLPAKLAAVMDNVVVLVDDEHDEDPDLLGLYEGTPLTERDGTYLLQAPDTVTIYRLPLLDMCADLDELRHEVQVTVVHEVAHHFGIDDARLHELGYE